MGLEGCIGGKVKTEDFYLAHIYHGPKIHVLHGNGDNLVGNTVVVYVSGRGVGGHSLFERNRGTAIGYTYVVLECLLWAE